MMIRALAPCARPPRRGDARPFSPAPSFQPGIVLRPQPAQNVHGSAAGSHPLAPHPPRSTHTLLLVLFVARRWPPHTKPTRVRARRSTPQINVRKSARMTALLPPLEEGDGSPD
eukprot:237473-Prymnesium_polylepis.1